MASGYRNTDWTRLRPSREDWIRLAAFIDGEGAILLNRFHVRHSNRKSMWLRVVLVNTDLRMPDWCSQTFGGVIVSETRSKRKPTHSDAFRWHVSCKQAEWVLQNCLPFFLTKREQAEIGLAFQRTLGGPGITVSEETRQERERLRYELRAMKRVTPLFDTSPDETGPPRKRGPKPKTEATELVQ
jgi:hypothetical protein